MMDWHKAGEEKEKENEWEGKIEVYYLAGLVGFFSCLFCSLGFSEGAKPG